MQSSINNNRKCRICSKRITGRSDKKFCSLRCKNYYHINLRKASIAATQKIDTILHRNHAILMELMGKRASSKKIFRTQLEATNFSFTYHTHTTINRHGKVYHWLYDFAWMTFSDDQILVVRQ